LVLFMSRPWRHPKTGVYWFRKAVPADLRPILGKREVKITLRTHNPNVAQQQHIKVAAEVAEQWSRLRGQVQLDHIDYIALAGEYYRERVAANERNPVDIEKYKKDIWRENHWRELSKGSGKVSSQRNRGPHYAHSAESFLLGKGFILDDNQMEKFLIAFNDAISMSAEQLLKNSSGDYSEHPAAKKFPQFNPRKIGPELDLWTMWEKFSPRLKPSSRKRWRTVMNAVEVRFGRDLATLNFDELIKWRDELLQRLSPKTVSEVYFASLRWLLNRCVNERKLLSNVAVGIEIEVKPAPKVREREYTAEEAKKVLAATLRPSSKPMTIENAAVRRWVPWLLAYSGARLNEITQLRYQDIYCDTNPDDPDEPIWLMKITPEAGTVKTSSFRDVPLHPHLVEQGFIDYVMTRRGLPLFYDPNRARKKSEENPYFRKVGDRLTEWIRSIGINDEDVQPNHAWRHLFKSTGRYVKIPADALDAIQGHKPANEGASYGGYWPKLSYDYIKRFPRFEVEGLVAKPPKKSVRTRSRQPSSRLPSPKPKPRKTSKS